MKIQILFYSLINFYVVSTNHKDDCNNEITYGFKQNFSWNIPTTTGFFVATPECKDVDGKLIERQCIDSVWTPKNIVCNENFYSPRSKTNMNSIQTILTFDSRKENVFLLVYNPENVKNIECFTFIIEKKPVDSEIIFDSDSVDSRPFFSKRYLVYKLDIFPFPSEYWCEIYQNKNSTVLESEKIVGYNFDDSKRHQEFVIKINYKNGFITQNFLKSCKNLLEHCRLMKRNDKNKTIWVHVTLFFKNDQITNGYFKIYNNIRTIQYSQNIARFSVLNSDFCLRDKTFTNKMLHWNLTPLGEKAKPSQICLDKNGLILTRKCVGDFLHGAYFENFNQKCSEEISVSTNTMILYEIISQHNLTSETFKNISSIIKEDLVSTNDLSLFSDGLFETCDLDRFDEIEDDYYESINILNALDSKILSSSQISLNATDKILDSLEKFLIKHSENVLNETNASVTIKKNNIIIFATKPIFSNISGIALYGNSSSFLDYNLTYLSENDTLQTISRTNLDLALHVPSNLLILNENSSLIITIYFNDSLFNEENVTSKANSRIISVIMPGLGKYLEEPIPILMRPLNLNAKFDGCGYWQYGTSSPSRKGIWSTKGSEDINIDEMIYCTYTHLTHFGLLILSGRVNYEKETTSILADSFLPYSQPLDIITIIGCTFSLIGIVGIFLTAFMFRRFREKVGSKILMLLAIPISSEIILTQLAGIDNWHNNDTVCKIVGILLHYVVLLKFTWMFVIALLQYFRFVKVLGPMPERIFLKANLICWLVPVLPVLITAAISVESYTAGIQKFCYPKYWALYLGLFAPACVIIVFNIMIFGMIMINISRSKAVKYDKSGRMIRRQTYLAILLFFMLGLPWIFGILAEILPIGWIEITFVYLFCLTATLQGFVLFIFYVVLDKGTRNCWIEYFKTFRKH
nr:adhesion G-protein coupled receptor G2-like [Onthophagus taurus]